MVEKAGVELTAIDSATRVFNQVSAAAKATEKAFDSVGAAGAALATSFSLDKIIDETVAWEQASTRLNAALKATGNAAGVTRNQLDQMAHSLSDATPFSQKDISEAEANLVKFGNIHDQVFSEALKLTADYAAFTGSSMAAASQALGRALSDPINGLKALQREFGNLTFSQKQYIERLEAQGSTEEAQIAILDIVRSKIGGTAEAMNTGMVGALGDVKKAWEELATAIGRSEIAQAEAGGLSALLKDLSDPSSELRRGLSGGVEALRAAANPFGASGDAAAASGHAQATWEEQYARQQDFLSSVIAKSQQAQDRQDEARQKAIPLLRTWTKMLGDQTNEQRALDLVLEGEARLWNDREKAILLNIAAELDWRRVAKDRMDLAEREAKALQDFRDGTLGEEENLATRVKTVQDAWMKGTRDTFQDYIAHAKDGAQQAAFFFRNAFQNMEDALVSFAMTGKFNFHDFAQSVIADLIRIQVRQQLAGFASSSAVAGAAGSFGAFFGFPTTAPAIEVHTGGVIGEGAGRLRFVHPGYFENAPRMHSGGLAGDEVPAILQRGERVIPRGGSAGMVFNQSFQIGGNVTQSDLARTAQAAKDGTMAAIAEARRRWPNGPYGG